MGKRQPVHIVDVDKSHLLKPHISTSIRETAANFCANVNQVSKWRKKPWWPGTKHPEKYEVCLHKLDRARRTAGLEGAWARRARLLPIFKQSLEECDTKDENMSIPSHGSAVSADIKFRDRPPEDGEEIQTTTATTKPQLRQPRRTKNLAEDLKEFRAYTYELRKVVASLAHQNDPVSLKLYKALADSYSKAEKTVSDLQRAVLSHQRDKRQLIGIDEAKGLAVVAVTTMIKSLDELIVGFVDKVKELEFEAHDVPKIDSLAMRDIFEQIANDWRDQQALKMERGLKLGTQKKKA